MRNRHQSASIADYRALVDRLRLIAAVVLAIAIPLGGVGAWAFNPDSGAVLHSEVLWRIFGLMFEGGLLLVVVLVLAVGLFSITRWIAAICRSHHA